MSQFLPKEHAKVNPHIAPENAYIHIAAPLRHTYTTSTHIYNAQRHSLRNPPSRSGSYNTFAYLYITHFPLWREFSARTCGTSGDSLQQRAISRPSEQQQQVVLFTPQDHFAVGGSYTYTYTHAVVVVVVVVVVASLGFSRCVVIEIFVRCIYI